jgi:hypothetical protein
LPLRVVARTVRRILSRHWERLIDRREQPRAIGREVLRAPLFPKALEKTTAARSSGPSWSTAAEAIRFANA